MSYGFNNNRGNYGNRSFGNTDLSLVNHMCNFLGDTVTIFTTSGGASGCGFTGILMSVNCEYCRISTKIGRAPSNPLSEEICPNIGGRDDYADRDDYDSCGCSNLRGGYDEGEGSDRRGGYDECGCRGRRRDRRDRDDDFNGVGSVCDIPICKIAAFCHNAV